jgi:hypothetical protein
MKCNYYRAACVSIIVGLQACTPHMESKVPHKEKTQAAFPSDTYQAIADSGEPVYAINSTESEIIILVYRGGTFAKLGHNHVVISRDVHGFVLLAEDTDKSKADLYVPLRTLIVDESTKRIQAGFESNLSEKDIVDTRHNMLEKVLEVASNPFVFIHAESDGGIYKLHIVKADITLHGVTKKITLPVEIERTKKRLVISGKMVLRQSDFGIVPYSVFAGALSVKDEIVLNFQLDANRL